MRTFEGKFDGKDVKIGIVAGRNRNREKIPLHRNDRTNSRSPSYKTVSPVHGQRRFVYAASRHSHTG